MTVKRLPSGKYQVQINWYDNSGKRHFKKKSFDLKGEATKWEIEMLSRKQENILGTNGDIPFPEYFYQWYELYKESNVTERTQKTYMSAYKALKDYLGDIPTEKMDRRLYRQFIKKYGATHSKATVSKFNSLYHACVKDAIYDGDIKRDWIRGVDLVFNRQNTRQIEYLSIKDMQRLTEYLTSSLNPHFPSKYMILTSLFTGARLGEIQGLHWENINFKYHTIEINHAWNSEQNQDKPTKSQSSNRVIRVNQFLLDYLKGLQEVQNGQYEHVFVSQYGTIPTFRAVNKVLTTALKDLAINRQGFHFHSLRHTHVAYLLANHVDLYVIAKRLGHSDITITSRVYSYLIDEYRVKADDQIEGILDGLWGQVQNVGVN